MRSLRRRNNKHAHVVRTHGVTRKVEFESEDERACLDREVELIAEYHTYVGDPSADMSIASNFTLGGEGTQYACNDAHLEKARQVGRENMLALWDRQEFREHHSLRGAQLLRAYNDSGARAIAHAKFLADPDRRAAWQEKLAKAHAEPEYRKKRSEVMQRMQDNMSQEEKTLSGKRAVHFRWHVKRNLRNASCVFCCDDKL